MPFLNEDLEPIHTIQSIYDTIDVNNFEIIAIDDASDKKLDLNFSDVKLIQNKKRLGVDACRQIGVEVADSKCLLILDAHMRFKRDNWASKIINCIDKEPNTAWCTTCLGLGYGSMDINKPKGKYYGATLLFVDPSSNSNRPSRECLEPKWITKDIKKTEIEYEIPCILGANYGFSKDWFTYIRGLKGLKSWGSSEPFLSLKTWLAGGKCKITTDIEIGHKFRDDAPYVTQISDLYYNKLYICGTMLPMNLSKKIIDCLPKNINYKRAVEEIVKNKKDLEESKEYYKSIFKMNIQDYCRKFNLHI